MSKKKKNRPSDTPLIIAGAAVVGVAAIQWFIAVKEQRELRKMILVDADAEISEIHYARDAVLNEMNTGDFKPQNIDHIMETFEFHRLAHRFENE